MPLRVRQWGPERTGRIVCIHGLTHHGGVFEPLAQRLVADGHSVLAIDLLGHGDSKREPPWGSESHARAVIETLDTAGVERAVWVGHSYGGRVAATLATLEPDRTEGLALLDAPFRVPPERALQAIEIERLDWSFATVDGAIQAMLSSEMMVAPPRDTVEAFVRDDVRRGPDGRFRFRFSPGAAVVAWNEMALPPPPIARTPTLLLSPAQPLADPSERDRLYAEELGELQTSVTVPNGHNVLWESPAETSTAIADFLSAHKLPSE